MESRMTLPDDLVRLLGATTTDLHHDTVTPFVDLPEVPFQLAVVPDQPNQFVVDVSTPFTILRGQVTESGNAWAVDAQEGPTSLRAGDWLLDLEPGRVRVWRLKSSASTWRLPESDPTRGLAVPPWPGVEALVGGVGCPEWLRRRADELGASPDPLDPLCAAGMLLRLWNPTSAAERAMALERAMAGTSWLLPALRAWLAEGGSPLAETLHVVEQASVERAELLLALLVDLAELQARDQVLGRASASRVVTGRDDLESLRMLLAALGGPRQALEAALEELDEAAVVHSLIMSDLLYLEADDPWLNAVAAHEPDAWWGGLMR